MILAVPLRTTVCDHMKPWDMQYYICDHYKNVFDPLKVEAIEKGNIIGVQWHPEVSVEMPIFNKWLEKFF